MDHSEKSKHSMLLDLWLSSLDDLKIGIFILTLDESIQTHQTHTHTWKEKKKGLITLKVYVFVCYCVENYI